MSKTIIQKPNNTATTRAKLPTPARWALTSLSLSMLMPSLDTSIANAGLPTLAQSFNTKLGDKGFRAIYDLNKDNLINGLDLNILSGFYGQTC